MPLIFEDRKKRVIKVQEEIKFSTFSSFHLIAITARVRSKKQISSSATDDEDLIVKIDNKTFPKSGESKRLIDSPAAFSGGTLHNLSKGVYLLTFLKGKDHRIILEADKPHNTAVLESLEVYTVNLGSTLFLKIENQAEDGDRRPWITFAPDSLPLKSVTSTITYFRRKRDSDDIKIIIDGKTQGNFLRTIRHFLWRYVGSLLPWSSPSKTETETFVVNLPEGLHYLEFWADRMPILHTLTIDFGTRPSVPEGIPTVNNPKWTGDFYDDTPQMILARLIFGEAEGTSERAKIGVGWTVKNRVLAQREQEWGLTYHEVILKPGQYEAFVKKERLEKLTDPLNTKEEGVKKAWYDSYTTAGRVIENSVVDPTDGATNFYSTPIEKVPWWATEEHYKTQIDNLYFYKL